MKTNTQTGNAKPVRDLSDFCQQWPDLQKTLSAETIQQSNLPPDAKEVVVWLKLMAQKVIAE